MQRVLVAGVGNLLRGDDGFGVAVAERLAGEELAGMKVIETGIGGMAIVHELMNGYDALIVIDCVDRGGEPGALFVLEPEVDDPGRLSVAEWRERFSNFHLAEPSRILLLARALGVLPRQLRVVGCQPAAVDEMSESLSVPVRRAVQPAADLVRRLAAELLTPLATGRA